MSRRTHSFLVGSPDGNRGGDRVAAAVVVRYDIAEDPLQQLAGVLLDYELVDVALERLDAEPLPHLPNWEARVKAPRTKIDEVPRRDGGGEPIGNNRHIPQEPPPPRHSERNPRPPLQAGQRGEPPRGGDVVGEGIDEQLPRRRQCPQGAPLGLYGRSDVPGGDRADQISDPVSQGADDHLSPLGLLDLHLGRVVPVEDRLEAVPVPVQAAEGPLSGLEGAGPRPLVDRCGVCGSRGDRVKRGTGGGGVPLGLTADGRYRLDQVLLQQPVLLVPYGEDLEEALLHGAGVPQSGQVRRVRRGVPPPGKDVDGLPGPGGGEGVRGRGRAGAGSRGCGCGCGRGRPEEGASVRVRVRVRVPAQPVPPRAGV